MINLYVYGDPVAQGRPRFTNKGGFPHVFDPKLSADWKKTITQQVILEMKRQGLTQYEPGVALVISTVFNLKAPQRLCKKLDTPHTTKPDADNLLKPIVDAILERTIKAALIPVVCKDDNQVVSMLVYKRYALAPQLTGVNIAVLTLDEYIATGILSVILSKLHKEVDND